MASNFEDQEQYVRTSSVHEVDFLNYSIKLEVVKKSRPKKVDKPTDDIELKIREKISKDDISLPNNFKHLSHIGLSSFGEEITKMMQKESEIAESQLRSPYAVPQKKSCRQKRLKSCDDIPEDSESLSGEAFQLSDSFEFGYAVPFTLKKQFSTHDSIRRTRDPSPGLEFRRTTLGEFPSVRARTMLFENISAENRQTLPTLKPKKFKKPTTNTWSWSQNFDLNYFMILILLFKCVSNMMFWDKTCCE